MIEDGVGPADPYGEGMDAEARGLARDACPHPAGGAEEERWLAGWDRQRLSRGDIATL